MSVLTLRRSERPEQQLGFGARKTGRIYADFVVDGVPLSSYLAGADLVSRLGWGEAMAQEEAAGRLLCSLPPDYAWGGGRTAIYVCPEDADLMCGAITVVIERRAHTIIWRDFGFETGLEEDPTQLDRSGFEGVGPFTFAWPQYESAILGGVWPLGLEG